MKRMPETPYGTAVTNRRESCYTDADTSRMQRGGASGRQMTRRWNAIFIHVKCCMAIRSVFSLLENLFLCVY